MFDVVVFAESIVELLIKFVAVVGFLSLGPLLAYALCRWCLFWLHRAVSLVKVLASDSSKSEMLR